MKRFALFFSLMLAVVVLLYGHLALQAAPDGNTYYISPNGNDNNSGATTNKPWATFNRHCNLINPEHGERCSDDQKNRIFDLIEHLKTLSYLGK
ncbi:MAG: hypothetical protein KC425_21365, partial [Anaerolineales bacterium]|nr:hypothetical protein [Anaerolineales bacterium]